MRPLEALQRRFVRSITFVTDADFVASVTGGGKLTAAEAVEVYRRGYPARLTEALGETYQGCWRVLGDDDFFAVTRDFIARFPSLTHNLSDYGVAFPEFLESRPESEDLPFVGDLARFEWAFKELFHRAPHVGLSPEALAAAAKPNGALKFGSAVSFLSLRHRVYDIWRRDRNDDTPLEEKDYMGEQRLILYKTDGNPIFVKELSGPEHAVLTALASGRSLEASLSETQGLTHEATQRLFAFVADARLVVEAV